MKQIIGRFSNVSVWFVAPLNGESNSLDATTVYFRLRIETCNFLMSSHSMGFTPDEPKQIPRQHGDMHFEQASFEGRGFSLFYLLLLAIKSRGEWTSRVMVAIRWQSREAPNFKRIFGAFIKTVFKFSHLSRTGTLIDPPISRLSQANQNPWGLFINSWHPIRPFN